MEMGEQAKTVDILKLAESDIHSILLIGIKYFLYYYF